MQAIVETLFDTVYLISVITIGILMVRKSKGNRQFTMFGIMAVLKMYYGTESTSPMKS